MTGDTYGRTSVGLPTGFLLGAARSGTSFLAHSLATHDSIALTEPKEPHFMALHGWAANFSGPGDDSSINIYSVVDEHSYRALFAGLGHGQIGLDASVTSLYYYKRAIPNIRKFSTSSPRFCVILRDPLQRAFSSYMYQRARGFEPLDSFMDALDAEPDRIERGWQHMFHYRGVSDYGPAVSAFRKEFGPESLHISFYEDLVEDPLNVLNSIVRHLELQPFDSLPIAHSVNSSGNPRLKILTTAQQRLRAHPRVRGVLRQLVPIQHRERIRRANLERSQFDAAPLRGNVEWAELYQRASEELVEVPESWM